MALVVVAGREPLRLRCQGKGHIRRDCRVRRCNACRRFGLEKGQCVRSYAAAVRPLSSEGSSELLMDETEVEEAATAGTEPSALKSTMTKLPIHTTAAKRVSQSNFEREEDPTADGVASSEDAIATSVETLTDATSKEAEVMDTKSLASTPLLNSDEAPPPKTVGAVGARRASMRSRSIAPMDARLAGKPPP
ncbi:hypothetical protein HPB52_019267 [Rhipicephalus sanguineus]|uniref:CCHC-type domain-containing protein n=1 Tax=Rhipicephalus sanguineus TaxID=34632 RepID=A0A9D4PLD2_RHISA|nr:hypothetical protein HPB52_019267 [Rhipicephalus sanguineus]